MRIYTGQNRESDREETGCMKLCGSFHITPEPEHGRVLLSLVILVPVPFPVSGLGSTQGEYTIMTYKGDAYGGY